MREEIHLDDAQLSALADEVQRRLVTRLFWVLLANALTIMSLVGGVAIAYADLHSRAAENRTVNSEQTRRIDQMYADNTAMRGQIQAQLTELSAKLDELNRFLRDRRYELRP